MENISAIFEYKNERGVFLIKIVEKEINERNFYDDYQIRFSIIIENLDNSEWRIFFNEPNGYIKNINEKNKLIEKLKTIIIYWIDKDITGEININDSDLDLVGRKTKY